MNKKIILFIGPLPPPEGGMATSLKNILNSDLKEKYELLALDITGKRTRYKGGIFAGFFYQMTLIFRLVSILLKKRPGIVHIQMTCFLYFYRRALDIIICKLFGVKVIFHLRGGYFIKFYDESPFLCRAFIRMILKISDRAVALSEVWRDFLSTIMDLKKIVIIPNGVRRSDFHLMKNRKEELGFSNDRILIIFMGTIGPKKGAFDILRGIPEMIGETRDIAFVFCGPEECDGELERFKNLVREGGLEPYVKYAGVVMAQEKLDYYLSSDIFILPSYVENMPNSLLEAMAAGLPVIVSKVGANPEIVIDKENGFLVAPGDINAITKRIIELSKDKHMRESMGKKNLEIVRDKYDMPIVSGKIDRLYRELLG
ncbi:MAG: glycosyltransferase family 4 protein [Candidatus Omnitrophica bacterium]|nr:glycosyltransferase family 4 protein [Candidatus Omnitrophota bacterium]